jgi:dihydrofolate reductase
MPDPHSTKAAARVEPRLARHPVVLVAAVARNGVIGAGGALPWRLPGDLAHFRRSTTGRPMVMGRRTFEGIGRPLPGRPTVVLSADPLFAPAGVAVARSLAEAFGWADQEADRLGADAVMVAGGATLYAATIARADRLLLTAVDAIPDGDALFPPVDPALWRETERWRTPPACDDSAAYEFTRWERRAT